MNFLPHNQGISPKDPLARLRSRFQHSPNERDRSPCVEPDVFGDIYWVARDAWTGCGGLGDDPEKPFRPGLVTALCPDPMKPMEMAPGSRTRDNRNIKGFPAQLFRPESSVDWVIDADRRAKRQFFILYYYRPVARGHIDLLMGRISELDRKRLAIEMDAARMIADMVREAENDDE